MLLSGSPVFAAPVTFDTGGLPQAAAVADFNSDGHADVAVTGLANGSAVGIMLGNGDGTFQAARTFLGGVRARSVAVADLNGDGRPDLIAPDTFDGTVSILLGNGDGTFQPRSLVNSDFKISQIVVADFNGDGKFDLAVANVTTTRVDMFLGNGDGTFGNIQFVNTGTATISAAAADLNRDGKLDLVVASYDNGDVVTLLGNGDGTFQTPQSFLSDNSATALTTADFNGDGRPDLAVTSNGNPGRVNVLTGAGDGTLAAPWTMAALNGYTRCVAAADFNGDGKPDLAVGGTGGALAVMLGNGNGTFETPLTFAATSNSFSVVPFDVNRDGLLDCVMPDISAGGTAGGLDVLLADVPPSVVSIVPTVNGTTPNYTADSSLDYVVTFSEPVTGVDPTDFQVVTTGSATANPVVAVSGGPMVYTVTVSGIGGGQSLANPSDGVTLGLNVVNDGSIVDASGQKLQSRSFVLFGPAKTFAASNGAWQVAADDINGDGKTDVALANYVASTVSVALGNGDGTFGPARTFAVGTHPFSVAAIDANRDGRVDLVVSNQGSNNVGVLLGNGDGTFAPQVTFATGSSPWKVSSADVNRDGIPDVLIANKNSGSLSVLLGNGDGTFKPQLTFATGAGPTGIALADFDGDGRIDVAVPNSSANTISMLLGNGDGTFHAGATFGAQASAVFAADVNGDGKIDLVLNSAKVVLGNGDGTFGPPLVATTFYGPSAVADMNDDGKLDLVGIWGGTVAIQLGNGDGTFGPVHSFTAPSVTTLTVVDVDHNGYPDVLTGSSYASTVGAMPAKGDGSFVGKTVYVVPYLNVATYPVPYNSITLMRNLDGLHIDAFSPRGFAIGQVLINDPAGMTVEGNGQTDEIHLGYSNGNPFPNTLHLSGKFTVTGLQGANPLAGTKIDIGQSTVYFAYAPGSSPLAAVQQALTAGYNGGAWNGAASGSGGAITSTSAAANPARYSIGYADSADGSGANTTPNTVEIKYTLNGDANLNAAVDIFDLNALLPQFNSAGVWTSGDFTYDGKVDIFDLNALLPNFSQTIAPASSASASPEGAGALSAAAVNASSAATSSSVTAPDQPVLSATAADKRHPKRWQKLRI